jgi:hypothetical protein
LEVGFADRRTNRTIGWALVGVAGLALLGAVGLLALKFALNRPWSAAIGLLNCSLIVFVIAAGVGVWLLLKARGTPAFRLWLCPRGLVWQKDEGADCCRWAELRNVHGGGTRIITVRRGGMFTDDKVVNREQFFAYQIALPDGAFLHFNTRQTRLAKPFMDRVQFEVIQALVPESGRRLQAGETLTFGPFRIDTRAVWHGSKQVGWGELGRVDVVKGSLLLYRADGGVWAEEPMARVAHAPVFIKMAEILIEAHAGSRPQQDQPNPFAF